MGQFMQLTISSVISNIFKGKVQHSSDAMKRLLDGKLNMHKVQSQEARSREKYQIFFV